VLYTYINNRGHLLVEAIIATAIFAVIGVSITTLMLGSLRTLSHAGEQSYGEALAQEGMEAVRSLRDNAWNTNTFTTSAVSIANNKWNFGVEGSTETIGNYTRTVSFASVCRGADNVIAACPSVYTDVHTKFATVEVSWTTPDGAVNTVERTGYITNWDSKDWTQTDWFGGNGQTTWSDTAKYNTQDGNAASTTAGQLTIISGDTQDDGFDTAGDSSINWPFSVATNYTYNDDDIVVTGAVAQLVGTGGSTITSTTVNHTFDTNSADWTYDDWSQPGEVDVTGNHSTTNGNPSGYIDVDIPGKKNSTISGYWEQAFTTANADPDVATTTLDWKVFAYSATLLDSYQAYVFVDSASGDPTLGQEVWSSGEISATTDWQSVSDIDVSSKIGAAGTYYLKIAVRAVTSGGTGSPGTKNVGFDNVKLFWKKVLPASYPSDEPDIYPDDSTSVSGLKNWTSFSENATKNGGEIHYQLSNDNGSTWQYWDGAAWAGAGVGNYNTSTVVNANIASFTTINSQIKFKAFLDSDSTQQIQLDNVNIGYDGATSYWNYTTWDVDGGEVIPTGVNQSSGGNDGRFGEITVPAGGNDEVGGYWEQPFTTYRDNPTGLTLNFDYKVIDYNGTPNVAEVRSYIDTAPGEPTTLVAATTFSAEGGWNAVATSTPTAAITTAGKYYLKIALWIETPAGGGANATGPFQVGFDNINIDLGNGEYPTAADLTSSDFDTGGLSKIQVLEWDEIDPGAAYAMKFQIRTAKTQAGLADAQWSGPDGKDGDTTDYFTHASGTLIHTDHNTDRWMRYKTFLTGDGDDTPTLQEVRINYK
jgi:Tfp pilus assembly protein PilV